MFLLFEEIFTNLTLRFFSLKKQCILTLDQILNLKRPRRAITNTL